MRFPGSAARMKRGRRKAVIARLVQGKLVHGIARGPRPSPGLSGLVHRPRFLWLPEDRVGFNLLRAFTKGLGGWAGIGEVFP